MYKIVLRSLKVPTLLLLGQVNLIQAKFEWLESLNLDSIGLGRPNLSYVESPNLACVGSSRPNPSEVEGLESPNLEERLQSFIENITLLEASTLECIS